MLHTGCRTSEASWIVLNKSFETSSYDFFHAKHSYIATMPMTHTKTHKNYRWIVPEALEPVMKVIMKMKRRGYTRPESLANYLGEYLLT